MSFSEKCFKTLKKIGDIIVRSLMAVVLTLIAVVAIADITTLAFMAIKNTTGYCTPFMASAIEKMSGINRRALEAWSKDY